MASDFTSLSDTAQRIAQERQASLPAVIKELLHYEILLALMESGSASGLVFQGGTALRLCYGGIRYSEDLDFAGGLAFEPSVMAPFVERVKGNLTERYGLNMDVGVHLPDPTDKVPVGRWKATVRLPQLARSVKRSYFIHIEVAQVPAYSSELMPLRTLSSSVPSVYRSVLFRTESKEEILADKIVALGARSYVKQRDLWDLYMLTQESVSLNTNWVQQKMRDYGLDVGTFLVSLQSRCTYLSDQAAESAFQKEMLRFLEGPNRSLVEDPLVVRQILTTTARVAERALGQLAPNQTPTGTIRPSLHL